MEHRFDLLKNQGSAKSLRHLVAAGKATLESTVPPETQELVRIRVSQINSCAFCTDMHIKEALHAGEDAQRLHLVSVWRDANVFTEAERAALELAEQGTRIADAAGGITDDAWANAAKHYDEEQLAALAALIAVMNAFNRMNVIAGNPGGDYQVGQFR
ncbi:carboxymuconolactone decarboxylase family protein [Actinoalloteichus hymeniacidonis]|uniref:Alkylhydroperoxidase AhpD family core domain n=1 Tax=Actinoalloteichus hymeniacidonis TaxID=340345 RepID=A0AAC9MZR0_9PSEU|nr:carboxymuconolactone decarboxylase family protein [Actinoalloteichus hymeniacidonis]AOS64694.1 alkylhydroperoxidase AhpD family core domain [Actinoalloteichus hymeniacidonis]MBB5907231.1 AhpD family alkylhydroperoxidase [Actinoalloteichus hymeniacidonis]